MNVLMREVETGPTSLVATKLQEVNYLEYSSIIRGSRAAELMLEGYSQVRKKVNIIPAVSSSAAERM